MKIKDAYDYLIHLIACTIHNETPQPLPEEITYERVLSCAIRHDVAGFAYLGVMRSKVKPGATILDKWKQRYLLASAAISNRKRHGKIFLPNFTHRASQRLKYKAQK